MVSEPEELPAFASYLEDINILQGSFHSSQLIHIPRTLNSWADSLAQRARKQPSFVVHMDAELPIWFTKFILICCFVADKKSFEIQCLLYNQKKNCKQ